VIHGLEPTECMVVSDMSLSSFVGEGGISDDHRGGSVT
jgi:hypothetical protein